MDRQDVENIINANITDNTTRDITPGKVRTVLDAILDWIDASAAGGGVVTLDVSTATKYTIPAGKKLGAIVVIPNEDMDGFGVGSSSGAFDILPALPVADEATEFTLELYADGARDVWFNGITAQTTIKIFLQ